MATESQRHGLACRSLPTPTTLDLEMTMNRLLKPLIAGLALSGALAALPVAAQEATPWPELWMKASDRNKDGMVTKQEFVDTMARLWDERHAKMMAADPGMKVGMMSRSEFMRFARDLTDPGQIGGS